MTETDTSRETVDRLIEPIRQHIADVEAERDRLGYIAATIRVNAMKRGATDEQIEAFLRGEQSFIQWIVDEVADVDSRALLARAEKAEAERVTAWNDAIEAAARAQEAAFRKGVFGEKHSDHIRALKKGDTP